MDGQILYEISTKGNTLMYKENLQITDKGINYTTGGAVSLIAKENLFIPYSQIAAVEIIKLIMGIQHDLIITSTSGKKIRIRNLYKDDAEKAKSVIYESQKKSLTSSNNNQNNQGSLDVADQIAKLSSLKDQGILTQDEFDTQKKKLLGL
jgi:hypothetical protein